MIKIDKDIENRIDNVDSLEELERAFGRSLKPQSHRKNPFRSKPIPKGKIEWAIQNTKSIRAASKFLGVAYNTFKKYAKMYDLFYQNKNEKGIGVNKGGDNYKTTAWLSSILSGKHPKYPDNKLLKRLINVGWLVQECSNCGYSEFRRNDGQSPLVLDYIDGCTDRSSRDLSNIRTLCYNCFFILKLDEKSFKNAPKSPETMRYSLQRMKTWETKNKDKEKE